jgi:hypothetical protein
MKSSVEVLYYNNRWFVDIADPQGVALGWHVTAPSGRNPDSGTFARPPRMGLNKSARGNALGFIQECQSTSVHPWFATKNLDQVND